MKKNLSRMARYDAPSDGGGGITPEQFAQLGQKIAKIATDHDEAKSKADKALESVEKMDKDLALEMGKLGSEIKLMKTALTSRYGPSGAEDWLNEMSKFMTGLWQFAMTKGAKVDPELTLSNGVKIEDLIRSSKVENKAAVDFTTAETASAAVLLPTILRPGIIDLKDIYGTIYPRVTKMSIPAGHNVDLNAELTRPTAYWRATQVGAMTEEATPMAFAKRSLNTMLCGTYIQVSNELIKSPHINFAAIATVRMVKGIMRLLEAALLVNQDATSGPADGVINYSGTNNQGNIATATFANVVTFLQAAITDNSWAASESGSQLIMHPTDALSLAAEAVGASELTGMLVWGNPRAGIPTTLLGREVIQHPAAISTNRYMMLGDLADIILGEDASFTIDVNPWLETAYKENASWIRVLNHYDWVIGQPSEWHFTTVGA